MYKQCKHAKDTFEYNAQSIQQLEIVLLLYNPMKPVLHLMERKVCTLEEQNTSEWCEINKLLGT